APSPVAAADGQIPPWLWLPLLLGAGGLLWAFFKRPPRRINPCGLG
ncbi:MAG: hypothetical protein HC860_09290, partial [Alkalinema sp. RU_4_3]|nr:hypothetical protein [Alkalinema sp. RU_4_3]